jgi:hypothetical protein
MSYNLFDISYRIASELGKVVEGIATGGSATSTVDAVTLDDAYYDNSHFNLGTVWILRDAAGLGASPEGKYAKVSAFTAATGTLTHATVTDAVAAGDRYAVADGEYSIDTIIQHVNRVLSTIQVRTEDVTTVDTAEGQTEYTLPSGILDESIQVYLELNDDANDHQWMPVHDWYIEETGTGVAKKLIFKTQPLYATDVKIVYWIPHPALSVNTDKLRESVNIDRVVFATVLSLLNWRIGQEPAISAVYQVNMNYFAERLERVKRPSTKHNVKLSTLGIVDPGAEIEY